MKNSNQVIHEFNDVVNMTPSDLEKWLKSGDSRSAGWPKQDDSGESVGHDSGRKIVEILKANPGKKPDKYTEDQIQHMRKVVSYCKRHLAQEGKANSEKSPEEVKKTKSYASLKNWGHDPLKERSDVEDNDGQDDDTAELVDKEEEEAAESEEDESEDNENEEEKEEEAVDEEEEGVQTRSDKRKRPSTRQSSAANKKRETAKGKISATNKKSGKGRAKDVDEGENDNDKDDENADANEEVDEVEEEDDGQDNNDGEDGEDAEDHNEDDGAEKTAKKGPNPGDTVSWNWGNGQPEGKVLDVKDEKTTITTKRGNKVSRDGNPEDPAVVLDTGKSKAIKSSHELNRS